VLDVGLTFGHRIGVVDGSGELYVERGDLPAAIYDDFIANNTGTFHFGGNTNYDILSELPQINSLKVSGIGQRRLPNLDLTLLGNLTIDGTDNTLALINEHDKRIEVQNNIVFNQGTFDAGSGVDAVFAATGSQGQIISGTGSFTGSNGFNHFEIDNIYGVTLNRPAEINNNLVFKNGG